MHRNGWRRSRYPSAVRPGALRFPLLPAFARAPANSRKTLVCSGTISPCSPCKPFSVRSRRRADARILLPTSLRTGSPVRRRPTARPSKFRRGMIAGDIACLPAAREHDRQQVHFRLSLDVADPHQQEAHGRHPRRAVDGHHVGQVQTLNRSGLAAEPPLPLQERRQRPVPASCVPARETGCPSGRKSYRTAAPHPAIPPLRLAMPVETSRRRAGRASESTATRRSAGTSSARTAPRASARETATGPVRRTARIATGWPRPASSPPRTAAERPGLWGCPARGTRCVPRPNASVLLPQADDPPHPPQQRVGAVLLAPRRSASRVMVFGVDDQRQIQPLGVGPREAGVAVAFHCIGVRTPSRSPR